MDFISNYNHPTVLTYHRIVDSLASDPQFHDLSFDRFKIQMETLLERTRTKNNIKNIHITFDDGTEDHLPAGILLNELGLKGTFFIITGWLDKPGYLTRNQVRFLSTMGHRIGSHTVSHRLLNDLSKSDLDDELTNSKRFLEDLTGQTINWFAAPGGVFNSFVLERALERGYSIFRTMEWGYPKEPLQGRIPCIPVFEHHDQASFIRILEGKASIWPYMAKNYIKIITGERVYERLRSYYSSLKKFI